MLYQTGGVSGCPIHSSCQLCVGIRSRMEVPWSGQSLGLHPAVQLVSVATGSLRKTAAYDAFASKTRSLSVFTLNFFLHYIRVVQVTPKHHKIMGAV